MPCSSHHPVTVFTLCGRSIDLYDINQMEISFLQQLNFDVHVSRSTYLQFYFELHALTGEGKQWSLNPLTDEQAYMLEANSREIKDQLISCKEKWEAIQPGSFSLPSFGAGGVQAKHRNRYVIQ